MKIDTWRVTTIMWSAALTAVAIGNLPAAAQTSSPAQVPATPVATIGSVAEAQKPATDAAAGGGMNDIVVTAQRREEKLQNVPIAVTAISGTTLEALGIEGSKQLTQVTPGLNFTQSVYSPQPTIRGIGTRGVGSGDESVVPIFINGVYQPFIQAADLQLNNVERIEVLKGPQGALFGRNAMGGAINIITRTPPDDGFTGRISGSYGRFDEKIGKLFAGVGGEKIGADIAALYHRDDGYIRDVLTGKRDGQMRDQSYRGQLRFTPSDSVNFLLGLGYTKNNDTTGSAYQPLDGNSTAKRFVPTPVLATEPYEVALGLGPLNRLIQYSASLVGTFNFAKFDLHTITGIQDNKFTALADSDATPLLVSELYVAQQSKTFYQEGYVTSTWEGPFSLIAGGVYYHDNATAGPSIARSGTSTRTASGPITFSSSESALKTNSFAGYAQGTFRFNEDLSLTVGGRYTSERRAIRLQTLAPAVGPVFTGAKTFHKFTPSANINWRVSPELNVYAKVGKAFKSGLFTLVNTTVLPVEPENVTQYEIGFKSDPASWLRINADVYYSDYKGLQTTARDPITGAAFLQNAASARIYGGELEFVIKPVRRLNISGGISVLHGTYSRFPDAQVTRPTLATACPAGTFPCGNTTAFVDVSGNDIIRTPFFTLNVSGDYSVPTPLGSLNFSGNVYRSGHSYWDPLNRLREPARTQINAQTRLALNDDRTAIALWAENLTKEVYNLTVVTSTSDTHVYAKPRTFGVRVEYKW